MRSYKPEQWHVCIFPWFTQTANSSREAASPPSYLRSAKHQLVQNVIRLTQRHLQRKQQSTCALSMDLWQAELKMNKK